MNGGSDFRLSQWRYDTPNSDTKTSISRTVQVELNARIGHP